MNTDYTVIIPTHNEEHRLALAARNFLGRARIVVVDNYSTDGTVGLAESLGISVVRHKNPGFADVGTYRLILEKVQTEWFWLIYCGHYIPLDLIEGCEAAMSSGRYDAVALEGFAVQYGKRTSVYGLNRRRRMETTRLAKKSVIDLARYRIHSELPYSGSDERVWYPPMDAAHMIHNFREDDLEMMNAKTAAYSREEARQRFEKGDRASTRSLLLVPAVDLAKRLFWRGGLREGWPGILVAVAQSYQRFCVEAHLLELQNDAMRDGQRRLNAETRDRCLKQSGR